MNSKFSFSDAQCNVTLRGGVWKNLGHFQTFFLLVLSHANMQRKVFLWGQAIPNHLKVGKFWFWGPTYPTYLYDVTLFSLFFLNASLNNSCGKELKRQQIFKYDPCPSSPSVSSYSKVQTVQDKREYFELPTQQQEIF